VEFVVTEYDGFFTPYILKAITYPPVNVDELKPLITFIIYLLSVEGTHFRFFHTFLIAVQVRL
jgi:hypothetical protein